MKRKIMMIYCGLFAGQALQAASFTVFKVSNDTAYIDLNKKSKILEERFICSRNQVESHPVTGKEISIKEHIGFADLKALEDEYAVVRIIENSEERRLKAGDFCEFYDPRRIEKIMEDRKKEGIDSGYRRNTLSVEMEYASLAPKVSNLNGALWYQYFTNFKWIMVSRMGFGAYSADQRGLSAQQLNTPGVNERPVFYYGNKQIEWATRANDWTTLVTGVIVGVTNDSLAYGAEAGFRFGYKNFMNVTTSFRFMEKESEAASLPYSANIFLNVPVSNRLSMRMGTEIGNFPRGMVSSTKMLFGASYRIGTFTPYLAGGFNGNSGSTVGFTGKSRVDYEY